MEKVEKSLSTAQPPTVRVLKRDLTCCRSRALIPNTRRSRHKGVDAGGKGRQLSEPNEFAEGGGVIGDGDPCHWSSECNGDQ